jgi:hypothetical protein
MGWFVGFAFGVGATFAFAGVSLEMERNECAKIHNVFTCKYATTWVPITNSVNGPPLP